MPTKKKSSSKKGASGASSKRSTASHEKAGSKDSHIQSGSTGVASDSTIHSQDAQPNNRNQSERGNRNGNKARDIDVGLESDDFNSDEADNEPVESSRRSSERDLET